MDGLAGTIGLHKVDHIGIAVRSIEATMPLFRDLLGGEFINGGDDPVLGIRTVQLRLQPGIRVELLQPVAEDCYLHGVIDKRGEGVHHITVIVADIHHALGALDDAGYEVVDTDLESDPTWKQTYIRPRSGHGLLLQVVESTHDWDTPDPGSSLDEVLAGRMVWQGDHAVPLAQFEG